MLQRGDLMPHFTVRTLQGESFSYSSIWQHRNLVLVTRAGGDSESGRNDVSELLARQAEFSSEAGVGQVRPEPVPRVRG